MGKMLLLFNLKLNNLNIWCCLFREISTQHGKNVAYSSGIVRELGRMLLVLQKGYARWEKRCMFCRKGTQDGKDIACFTGRVRKIGRCCMFHSRSTRDGKGVACFTGRVRKMEKVLHVSQ
ncbi:hypothetical protein COL26_06305 [Bacillus thuringiensis]|uniref:Uncharacterized protein n=1 Tax=Bacillus thuringiensis TaxID=1428 RepID=A0ABD6SBE7_BACTU|nr:hypothetical protein CN495_26425 [Bacillus thuringiensis]PEU74497.1 hypothetical protein CN411_31810 [Bacillus thuringiensis]PFW47781.1 hypothetical protein COL26_06305 [Bacillus thuringiensis]